MAVLGIDFGTSYTMLVKKTDGDIERKNFKLLGDSSLYSFGDSSSSSDDLVTAKGIRTVIGIGSDGKCYVGENKVSKAIEQGKLSSADCCYDIKSKLRNLLDDTVFDINYNQTVVDLDDIPEDNRYGYFFSGKFIDAIELAQLFFKEVFETVQDIDLKDITCIVMGAPASDFDVTTNKGNDYQHLVLNIILEEIREYLAERLRVSRGSIEIRVRPEPSLAGRAFMSFFPKSPLGNSKKLLVIDIGGGTADFCRLDRKESGELFAPQPAYGNTTPAGDAFDAALENGIKQFFGLKNTDFSRREIEKAKEELFYPLHSQRIEFLARMNGYTEKAMYSEYCAHGRRTIVGDKNGKKYCVAFDSNHVKGVNRDGIEWQEGDNYYSYSDDFNDKCELLITHIKTYIETAGLSGDRNYCVLFTGGTSQMDMLREYIRVNALEGMDKCRVFSLDIHSRAILTYANMVAIGAACAADEQYDTIYSVPEIWLQFKGGEERYLLLSQNIKNGDSQPRQWPVIADYNEEEQPSSEESDASSDKFAYFKLIIKRSDNSEQIYPRKDGSCFRYKLPEDKRFRQLAFVADYSNSGEVGVFVCLLKKLTPSLDKNGKIIYINEKNKNINEENEKGIYAKYIIDTYEFRTINNMAYPKYFRKHFELVHAVKKNLRKYIITDKKGLPNAKICGKEYSISSANNMDDGYGWKLKSDGGEHNGK